jgi:hypothetical protein
VGPSCSAFFSASCSQQLPRRTPQPPPDARRPLLPAPALIPHRLRAAGGVMVACGIPALRKTSLQPPTKVFSFQSWSSSYFPLPLLISILSGVWLRPCSPPQPAERSRNLQGEGEEEGRGGERRGNFIPWTGAASRGRGKGAEQATSVPEIWHLRLLQQGRVRMGAGESEVGKNEEIERAGATIAMGARERRCCQTASSRSATSRSRRLESRTDRTSHPSLIFWRRSGC